MSNKYRYLNVPTCIGCHKTPSELPEYVQNPEGMPAHEYVIENEGTYHMFKPNQFYCDKCYIKAGMPSHHGRRQF